MSNEGLSKVDMRKTMQICGYNANVAKAAYTRTFFARAEIVQSFTGE